MRILIVNQYFPPDASATAYLLGELTEDLARHHDVTVVAGQPSYSAESSRYRPEGVTVVRAPSTRFSRTTLVGRASNYLSFLASSLVRGALLRRPDVVVAMTDPPVIGVVGTLLSMRYRRPLVHVVHDLYPDIAIALGKLPPGRPAALWRALNAFVWRRAALVCAVSRDMRAKLIDRGVPAERIEVVPTWASPQEPDAAGAAALRRELGWDGRLVVMHAGNLGLAQDAGTILTAAERLRDRDEVSFVFLG